MIARKGDGSMRDALSVLDQVLAFCGGLVKDEDVTALLGVVDRRLLLEASKAVFAGDCRALLDIVKKVDSFGYNMRQFTQELIDHFRNMTIIRAVGAAADLPELSEAELVEIREQASPVDLTDLQRHLAILLKAESEMAHTTFPRLVLEMALLKMATLVPVVPVDELLERLKALEGVRNGGMIASPLPYWGKSPAGLEGASVPQVRPGTAQVKSAAPSSRRQQHAEKRAVNAASEMDDERDTVDPWEGFVAFVRKRKPLLGSSLEHGHPLRVSATQLEIGFPSASFQLSRLQDPDTMTELRGLAMAFFRAETGIRLVSLKEGEGDIPETLLEKKSLEEVDRLHLIKEAATSHPMVAAALEIFGGEIADISEAADETEIK
jgi:DNA polymerase-3 subunit gamma/tau